VKRSIFFLYVAFAWMVAGCGATTDRSSTAQGESAATPADETTRASDEPAGESPAAPEQAAPTPLTKIALAEHVFAAVLARDFEHYRQFIMRAEDIAAAMPHLSPERVQELDEQVLATQRMMFEEAYATGEHRGVDWSNASFREAHQNGSDTRPNIFIVFESGGEPFSMKMDDCLETERGWVVGDYLDAPQRGESHRDPVD